MDFEGLGIVLQATNPNGEVLVEAKLLLDFASSLQSSQREEDDFALSFLLLEFASSLLLLDFLRVSALVSMVQSPSVQM